MMILVTRASEGGAHARSAAATVTPTNADLRNRADMFGNIVSSPLAFAWVAGDRALLADAALGRPLDVDACPPLERSLVSPRRWLPLRQTSDSDARLALHERTALCQLKCEHRP